MHDYVRYRADSSKDIFFPLSCSLLLQRQANREIIMCSWPLNDMGLNCMDSLIRGYFSIHIVTIFSFYISLKNVEKICVWLETRVRGMKRTRVWVFFFFFLGFESWLYANCFSFLPLGELFINSVFLLFFFFEAEIAICRFLTTFR